MPRKKADPEITITPLPGRGLDMMEMLEGMAGDLALESGEAMMAAVEFEKALLNIAHTLAGQAIRVDELAQEDERVKAAERQIKLLGKLYGQLQVITQPSGRRAPRTSVARRSGHRRAGPTRGTQPRSFPS